MQRTALALASIVAASVIFPVCARAEDWLDWQWYGITGPCDQKCAVMVFGGRFVETWMTDIFLKGDLSPFNWDYGDSGFIGVTASRTVASIWQERFTIEPEIGIGKRFGAMDEYETWAAVFLRYNYFPWNDYVYTTVALSTGLNYASGIPDLEKARAGNGRGDRLMHILPRKSPSHCPRTNRRNSSSAFITLPGHTGW